MGYVPGTHSATSAEVKALLARLKRRQFKCVRQHSKLATIYLMKKRGSRFVDITYWHAGERAGQGSIHVWKARMP